MSEYLISRPLVEALKQYLATRPAGEVFNLLAGVASLKESPPPETKKK